MSLAAPLALLALVLIPLAVGAHALARRRRRRFALRFPAAGTVAALVAGGATWRRRVPPLLLAAAVAALVLALARPHATVAVAVERASVVLVMDASRSMQAADVPPDRLSAARDAAHTFLDELPEELRVGLVAYSSAPHTVQPPTEDHDAIALGLDALAADGGTATGDALDAALGALEARRAGGDGERARGRGDRGRPPAAIVLLSDGKSTQGEDPVAVARRAARLGVPVHTVALGTAEGIVPGPAGSYTPVPPDPETLARIAEVSGGRASAVEDADELDAVYEQLGTEVGTKRERREVTSAVAGAGLLLLLAGVGTGLRWRGRVA